MKDRPNCYDLGRMHDWNIWGEVCKSCGARPVDVRDQLDLTAAKAWLRSTRSRAEPARP